MECVFCDKEKKTRLIGEYSAKMKYDTTFLVLLDLFNVCSERLHIHLADILQRIHGKVDNTTLIEDLRPLIHEFTYKATLTSQCLRLHNASIPCNTDDHVEVLAGELVSRIAEIDDLAEQYYVRTQNSVNWHISRVNLAESRAVKRLANLASISLPLTLSTGILSTQCRLVEQPILLWDFLTLCLNLGVIVLVILWVMTSRRLKTLRKDVVFECRRLVPTIKIDGYLPWLIAPTLILTIVAFNFGTFASMDMGWKIFAFGAAGGFGFLVVYLLLAICAQYSTPAFRLTHPAVTVRYFYTKYIKRSVNELYP